MIRVRLIRVQLFVLFVGLFIAPTVSKAQPAAAKAPLKAKASAARVAPTPPMGWNSWDAYGLTIDEAQFRDNVKVLASLKQHGWQYAVIDEGWYMRNPFANTMPEQKFLYDKNGLLLPVEARFPSSAGGKGFKPLADWVHSLGLKFGIHILRGIPKTVADENLPIAGSNFRAEDAVDRSATCPWSDANYGIKDNPAGQAYYDSMVKRYADWGVDFIKVDCIADHPYRPTEIRQIAEAIRKSGRPIVLSLSPGPTNLSHAEEIGKYAQMWRISNDHWDGWKFNQHTPDGFPFGLENEFDQIAEWNKYVKPGNWPDADMLPEGYLGPHPGLGEPRQSHYTHDEQRTEFTLWCISRSPLIFGGNLTKLDAFTRSLMTNRALIDADQSAFESYPVVELPAGFENVRVWHGAAGTRKNARVYMAFFNLGDRATTLDFAWKDFKFGGRIRTQDVFNGATTKPSEKMHVTLPPHGSAMYRLQ